MNSDAQKSLSEQGTTEDLWWKCNLEYFGIFPEDNEKNRQVRNGEAEGGSWCERESHKEAGEEPAKVGWTCGKNGRSTTDKESRWARSGG